MPRRPTTGERVMLPITIIGKVFGELTVETFVEHRRTPRGAKVPMVSCKCSCGKTKIVSAWDLRSGKTRSCAFNHPHFKDRSLPAFNNLYNHVYKSRALKKGIVFKISRNQFRELTQMPCHYCGTEPHNSGARMSCKTGKYISTYQYNGIDKKHPLKGYTMGNVVACCAMCNRAKNVMNYKDFIAWLDRLTDFRSKHR